MNSTPLFLGLACVYSSNGGMEERKNRQELSHHVLYTAAVCVFSARPFPSSRTREKSSILFLKKNYGDISWGIRALSL